MASQNGNRPPLVAEKRYNEPRRDEEERPKARRAKAPPPPPPSGNRVLRAIAGTFRFFFRSIWWLAWRTALIVGLIVGGSAAYIATTLPPIEEIVDGRHRGSVTMLDANGEIFAWRGEQFGGAITPETASPHLVNAVIATEDKRFYRHFGISPRGIASAIRINLREGRGPLSGNGGSTITQQTAKLLCLGVVYDPAIWESETVYEEDCRRTTLWRKAKEAIYALALEMRFTKDEILTIYLNRAYLGAGSRGFEAAAQRYFGISAAELNPSEAAMLAGLLKAPSTYAPTSNLERSRERANLIIGLMEEQGYLSATDAERARSRPAELSQAAQARAGGYFADWVMETAPSYLTEETTEDVVLLTTLDPRLQAAAEEALAFVFETKLREGSEAQAAIVVMSADGAVRAMVGGREQGGGGFNRATQALRQTGSSFKPFIYAAALDLGYGPYDMVVDEPYCLNIAGSGNWCPDNYTNDFRGRMSLSYALAHSVNVPAVKISESIGRDTVRLVAEQFGVESNLADGPALALGSSEATLIEMTGAYAGFLNGGRSVMPYGLVELRLKGESEPLIGQSGGMGERVISEDAARTLIFMLNRVITEGTGGRARLPDRDAAGKTGTTSALRDAWFIGFTADYVTGVWMGYDDNRPMTNVTGGGLPAEIWHEVMVRVHEGLPANPLPMIVPEPPQPQIAEAPRVELPGGRQIVVPGLDENDLEERILIDVLNDIFGN